MDKIRTFLSKIRTLFSISKKAGEAFPLPPMCAPVSVAEYASISHDHLTCSTSFENASGYK